METSTYFSLCILLCLFSVFTFPSTSPSSLFYHYSHYSFILILTSFFNNFFFKITFLSFLFHSCLCSPGTVFFSSLSSDSFTMSHLFVFFIHCNSLFVLSVAHGIFVISAEVHHLNLLKKESDLGKSSCNLKKPGGNFWKKNVETQTRTSSLNVHQDLITKMHHEDMQ